MNQSSNLRCQWDNIFMLHQLAFIYLCEIVVIVDDNNDEVIDLMQCYTYNETQVNLTSA